MADNTTLTNKKTTFDADTNPDIAVRTKENASGKHIQVVTSGFALPDYDYLAVTYPTASSEAYEFKTGGAGGTTVGTLTVVYTDATKVSLSTVTLS